MITVNKKNVIVLIHLASLCREPASNALDVSLSVSHARSLATETERCTAVHLCLAV